MLALKGVQAVIRFRVRSEIIDVTRSGIQSRLHWPTSSGHQCSADGSVPKDELAKCNPYYMAAGRIA